MKYKCFHLLTIALIVHQLNFACSNGGSGLQNTAAATAQRDELNATVAKLIGAIADTTVQGDNSAAEQARQEHAKKGRIFARKGVELNVNISTTTSTPIALPKPKASDAQQHNATTSTPLGGGGNSSTNPSSSAANNVTLGIVDSKNVTSNLTAAGSSVVLNNSNVTSTVNASLNLSTASTTIKPNASSTTVSTSTLPTTSTTTTTSTTPATSTTTTTTTSTTTTKAPKKPKITYSVDDEPKLLHAAKPGYTSASSFSAGSSVSDASGRLQVDEPLAELSKEYIPPPGGHREYVVPVVTLIFAIPLLMGLFLLSYRRAKEFWLTRHYRRMDFLVDGMYNY